MLYIGTFVLQSRGIDTDRFSPQNFIFGVIKVLFRRRPFLEYQEQVNLPVHTKVYGLKEDLVMVLLGRGDREQKVLEGIKSKN